MENKITELPKFLDWHYIKSVEDLPKKGKKCLLFIRRYFGRHEESIDVGYLVGVGVTSEQRASMEDCERKRTIKSQDQHGNNLVNWSFCTNSLHVCFGQDIVAWCYI